MAGWPCPRDAHLSTPWMLGVCDGSGTNGCFRDVPSRGGVGGHLSALSGPLAASYLWCPALLASPRRAYGASSGPSRSSSPQSVGHDS